MLRTGCAWRLLPSNFAPWQAVYKAFVRWVETDAFEHMHNRLRQQWRSRMGRSTEPTAAVIDAQSNRGSPQGGESGYDAGKKVKGRKRHIIVDTLGLLLAVTVTAASVQDRDGAADVVAQACRKAPTIARLYTDGAYGGQCAQAIEKAHGIRVEVVRRPGNRSTGTLHDPQQSLWREPTTGFVRKRHIVVDTLGLLLAVTVTAASVQDRDGAADVVAQACRKAPTIARLYTDGAYGADGAHRGPVLRTCLRLPWSSWRPGQAAVE